MTLANQGADSSLSEPLLSSPNDNDNDNDNNDNNNSNMSPPSRSSSSTIKVDWPETPVPLYVPPEWTSGETTEPQTCTFQYDVENNLLKLVTGRNTVVDVLDPEDVIGVEVEIKMTSTTTTTTTSFTPRAASASAVDNTATSESEEQQEGNGGVGSSTGRPSNAPATDTPNDSQGQAVLTIYAYPRRDPNHPEVSGEDGLLARFCGIGKTHPKPNPNYKRPTNEGEEEWKQWGHRYAFHRSLTVVASEDVGPLNALVRAIRQAANIDNTAKHRGRTLVIVNPKSGPKCNAEEMYENCVNVLLEQAGMEHDLCVTTHSKHAQERMKENYNNNSNDGEKDVLDYNAIVCMGGDGIVHEVLQGIHDRSDAKKFLGHVAIGIVGCGTSNGMAKSIAHESQEQSSVLDAAFLIAKGHTVPTDLSLYQTSTKKYCSFLTFSWAMIADCDIDSEIIRFLGTLRFDIWGVWCMLRMKKYRAKFSYLPGRHANVDMPPLSEPIPDNKGWVTEEDDFLLFWAAHVSHAGEKTYNSPKSRLDDGVFQILVVRYKNTSRLAMTKILLGIETGAHADHPQCEFIECSAYRLEPITKGSYNDLDGEVIEGGPIQAKVMPAAMNVFSKY